ncbi:hypothetical protein DACRYDRAFT_21691 [Dacryopinax primogenitus]|uniref:Uncharacterized protein n=1 Tax=Dacryopinax primogenitus (strain DJM 731) TaxID=1858805 RepID=M5FXF4_DACPD|nr:uncharacterized protein DACRYDRAFT_21691 [Dacryopinax primogenitus]EJU02666.1 hypothetical protein DACRYDRAFT_21691 [Dacryopinax primogenitus]
MQATHPSKQIPLNGMHEALRVAEVTRAFLNILFALSYLCIPEVATFGNRTQTRSGDMTDLGRRLEW